MDLDVWSRWSEISINKTGETSVSLPQGNVIDRVIESRSSMGEGGVVEVQGTAKLTPAQIPIGKSDTRLANS